MIHAYDKVYLDKARTVLGRMLDFAVYDLKLDLTEFFDLFISSGIAARFEQGDYAVIVGMSGVELTYKVLEESAIEATRIKPHYTAERSAEYWTGWALAYYQWVTSLKFSEIIRFAPIKMILSLYTPYHEMDVRQFCDKMNELYHRANPDTKLKLQRKSAGLSQRELAERSGVPLRTIQQYEQRQKSINRAQAEYLVMLAKVLCCDVEVLLEKTETASD